MRRDYTSDRFQRIATRGRTERTIELVALILLVVRFVSQPLMSDELTNVDPTAFGASHPRTRDLAKMLIGDCERRLRAANCRESREFAAVTTVEAWKEYRDRRIDSLRTSLGEMPTTAAKLRTMVAHQFDGDGFSVQNLLYETRDDWWVSANLYLPKAPQRPMPGIVIVHSHHTPKEHGELQDMGMTWARSGVAVLIPDQLGYGERRQHRFRSDKDFSAPYRASRQDYYFRYNSNLQLSAMGDSLMGWMVWDLMRGIDLLLSQPMVDRERIILIGAVAGGGDPAGVTAALDSRIAAVVPFNFGGWQPESTAVQDPERDFPWFGDGYWESTRGLRSGARDGFAHFVIVGSVAPRKLLYSHEFAWDPSVDPAWPRLQKIFGYYGAPASIKFAHGKGELKGQPPSSSHCTHVGDVHRKMIYPAFAEWFDTPVPDEYSQRVPSETLRCWTPKLVDELRPQSLHSVALRLAEQRARNVDSTDLRALRSNWGTWLGNIEPVDAPLVTNGITTETSRCTVRRFALETEPGITVTVILLLPPTAGKKLPCVLGVASEGKQRFVVERSEELALMLAARCAVCLVDVRGTGETRPGDSASRTSSRTSISQRYLMLGQPLLGAQLRDLRSVVRWLRGLGEIDGNRLAVWGESFVKPNEADVDLSMPLDVDGPRISEPTGANLAMLLGLFESHMAVCARGALSSRTIFEGPYLYLPHDAVIPAPMQVTDSVVPALRAAGIPLMFTSAVDSQNRRVLEPVSESQVAPWLLKSMHVEK